MVHSVSCAYVIGKNFIPSFWKRLLLRADCCHHPISCLRSANLFVQYANRGFGDRFSLRSEVEDVIVGVKLCLKERPDILASFGKFHFPGCSFERHCESKTTIDLI